MRFDTDASSFLFVFELWLGPGVADTLDAKVEPNAYSITDGSYATRPSRGTNRGTSLAARKRHDSVLGSSSMHLTFTARGRGYASNGACEFHIRIMLLFYSQFFCSFWCSENSKSM